MAFAFQLPRHHPIVAIDLIGKGGALSVWLIATKPPLLRGTALREKQYVS